MLGKPLKRRLKKWRPVLIVVAIVAIGVGVLFFLPDEEPAKRVPQIASTPIPTASPTMAPDEGEAIDQPPPFFDDDEDRGVEKEFKDPFEEKETKDPE